MLVRGEALTKYVAATADGGRCRIVDLLFDSRAWVVTSVLLGCEEAEGTLQRPAADVESIDVNGKVVVIASPRVGDPASQHTLSLLETAKYGDRAEKGKLGYAPGFRVQAADEWYLGQIADVLLDSETLDLRYLEMVGPGGWWQGVPKLLPASFVIGMDRVERKLFLRVAQRLILNAPVYNRNKPIKRNYEERLFAYYGDRPYWLGPLAGESARELQQETPVGGSDAAGEMS